MATRLHAGGARGGISDDSGRQDIEIGSPAHESKADSHHRGTSGGGAHKHSHGHSAHGHAHSNCSAHHCHDYSDQSFQALVIALFLVSAYFIVEVCGGLVANSLALLTDACHVLTDVAAVALSLLANHLSSKKETGRAFTFGYRRVEAIFALLVTVVVWITAVFLVIEGLGRLRHPEEVEGGVLVLISCIGVAVNLLLVAVLRRGREHSLNVRAVLVHSVGDLAANAAVLVGGGLIAITKWHRIDAIITLLAAVFVVGSTLHLFKDVFAVLMERAPASVDPYCLAFDLRKVGGVADLHELHVWALTPAAPCASVHLVIAADADSSAILQQAQAVFRDKYHVEHVTIQIERSGVDRLCASKVCILK